MSIPSLRYVHNGMRGSSMRLRGQKISSSTIISGLPGGFLMTRTLAMAVSRSEVRSSFRRLRGSPLRTSILRTSSYVEPIGTYSWIAVSGLLPTMLRPSFPLRAMSSMAVSGSINSVFMI